MVIHKCDICDYKTIYTTCMNKHLMSKKHQKNIINNNKTNNGFYCKICSKNFSTNSNLNRHLKKCQNELEKLKLKNQELYYENKLKEKDYENKLKDELLKEKDKCIEIIKDKNTTINNTTNNTMNNTINNNYSLKFLNQHYADTITMDEFLKTLYKCDLTQEHINKMCNIHKSYNANNITNVLIEIIKYHCEVNNINMLPLICNDSKLRTHKEKNSNGWERVLHKKNVEQIYHGIVSKVIQSTDGTEFTVDPVLCETKISKLLLKEYTSIDKIKLF